jgi:integrase
MATFRIRKDKNGGKRYQVIVEVRKNGRKIYKSKTFTTKREGLNWEKKFLYEVDAGIITKDSLRKRKVSDALEKYIETVLPQRPKNAHNILQHLKWWRDQIGGHQLSDATPAVFAGCRDKLLTEVGPKGRVRKSGTALRYIATMSSVLECCMKDWMWIAQNPLRAIKKPSPGPRKARFYSLEEIQTIRRLCASCNSPFMLPIFIVALHTGMRKGEVLGLRWENIDFREKEIHLPTSKNGEPRNIAMTSEVGKIFHDLDSTKKTGISGLIFPSPKDPQKPIDIKSTWERVLAKAGITDGTFHTIRHATCSYLASLGIDGKLIAKIVGHKDSRTTDIYIDTVKSHRREIMDRLGTLMSSESNA